MIVDGTDNFESKFLINDICCFFEKPLIYGAISQFEGQVSVFWKGHGPCYRCFIQEPPNSKIKNCAEAGVVGVLPGIIGSIQAMEALKTLLILKNYSSRLKPLLGTVQIYNFAENSIFNLKLSARKGCLCQDSSIQETAIRELEMKPCAILNKEYFIDVREEDEYLEFSDPAIEHWPLSKLMCGEIPKKPLNSPWVTICKSGVRAAQAAEILRSSGFQNVSYTEESIYGYQNR